MVSSANGDPDIAKVIKIQRGVAMMSKSRTGNLLSRREALLLSATAGMGILAEPARASDSIKTAAHQEPGTARRRAPQSPTPSTAKSEALWMEACTPSKAFLTARTRVVKTAGYPRSLRNLEG